MEDQFSLQITRREPISFNYPSITGREDEDDDVPMRERMVIAREAFAVEAEVCELYVEVNSALTKCTMCRG